MTKRRRKPQEPPLSPVSETEFEVLRVLWKHGPGTVRDIDGVLQGQGRRWAYTTVLTLLQRLEAKGYVSRETEGVAHVYHPAVTRERLLKTRLRELADRLTDGAATPLVEALVDGQRFTRDEIEHFRELLDRVEAERDERDKGPVTTSRAKKGPARPVRKLKPRGK